ncbi:MarC family protein [Pseudidiomarina sp. E22-M8]|uniref:MarC family protein n=1 Tax=Pseudidiomarina sp. E22-M8 TaxID=3424768 RepID=UPI00403C7291
MLDTFLFQFTSLFTMINPIAAIPIYIALTEAMTPKAARWVAMRAAITAFIALAVFALLGEVIFSFFNISVNGLRVAGGILFFVMGFEMLRGRTVPKRVDGETDGDFGSDVAVTPIGIPMIAGPGAITMVILFIQEGKTTVATASATISLFLAIAAVCVLTAIVLASGRQMLAKLGRSGSKILMRLMGLIVMLIAVEFFFAGIKPYIIDIATSIPA